MNNIHSNIHGKINDENEILLSKNTKRFVLFPIIYQDMYDLYKKAESSFWTANEIDLSKDLNDWEKLNENEKKFIENIIGFFAGSDGIIMENLACRFMNEIQIPEARAFYSYQIFNESVHSETYSLLINTYIKDSDGNFGTLILDYSSNSLSLDLINLFHFPDKNVCFIKENEWFYVDVKNPKIDLNKC
jgi:ribonucleoside-diphosphate reductase subunit M2